MKKGASQDIFKTRGKREFSGIIFKILKKEVSHGIYLRQVEKVASQRTFNAKDKVGFSQNIFNGKTGFSEDICKVKKQLLTGKRKRPFLGDICI